jgi:hypothetical protein
VKARHSLMALLIPGRNGGLKTARLSSSGERDRARIEVECTETDVDSDETELISIGFT